MREYSINRGMQAFLRLKIFFNVLKFDFTQMINPRKSGIDTKFCDC